MDLGATSVGDPFEVPSPDQGKPKKNSAQAGSGSLVRLGLRGLAVEDCPLPDLVQHIYGGLNIVVAAIDEALEHVLVVHPAQRPRRLLGFCKRVHEARLDPISDSSGDHGYDALDVSTPSLRGRRIVTRSLGERSEQFSVLSIETREPCELCAAGRNRIRAGRPF